MLPYSLALDNASLHVNADAAPLSGTALESLFADYNKVMTALPKMSSKIQKDILLQLMYYPALSKEDMHSQESMTAWTDGFIKKLPFIPSEGLHFKGTVKFDEIANCYYPVIIHHIHGMDYEYHLDSSFFDSADYALLKNMNRKVCDLIEDGAFVRSGSKEIKVANFHEAYETLMK